MALPEQTRVFDRDVWARSRWRAVRRALIAVIAVAGFVEWMGLPEVRLVGSDRGRVATYLGVHGVREVPRDSVEPLVVFRPLERSLLSYASEALSGSEGG